MSRAPVERLAGKLLAEMEAPNGALNGSALEKPIGDITPVEPPAAAEPSPEPVTAKAEPVKPVNPLRLARPLEKAAQGLSKTAIPPTRPMPMPTISPLCPPGSAAAKNGIKSPAVPAKNGNGTGPEPTKPVVPISQPLKATTTPVLPPDTKDEAKVQETPKEEKAPPPVTESLAADKPAPEKPALEKPEVDKPGPEIPVVEKAAPEKASVEKIAPEEEPAPENPVPEKPALENPAPEKPAPEKPAAVKPAAEKTIVEKQRPEKTAAEKQEPEKTAPEKAASLKPEAEAPSKPVEEPSSAPVTTPVVPQPKVVVPPTTPVQEPTVVKEDGKAEEDGKEDGKEEEEEEVPAPTSLPENEKPAATKPAAKAAKPQSPKKAPEGPKVPVAEKTPRQKKRKASQEVAPLPDDEKRLSKRARAPPTIYESPDPEMTQILKTIKKQEEEDKRVTSTSDKEDEKPLRQRAKKKAKVTQRRQQAKKNEVPADSDSDSDLDEPPSPKPTARSRVKAKSNAKPTPPASQAKKKGDPVFFKDEYMAVRNAEGSFYICKAMQNIFLGSKNIKIQWLSNEDPIVPAKDNPDGDIFAHDFYDKTEFETILTSVELEKTLGRSKRMILPEEELERIKKILQRAVDKAAGKLDLSDLLTEDNPDGLDISLYKGEDQLDEIERKRKGEEKKAEKKTGRKEVKQRVEKEVKDEIDFKPEVKKRGGRAKEDLPVEKAKQAEPRKGRRAASNISYDHDSYDFLEEDDDEVMPAPKKRKSQDSISESTPDEGGSKAEGGGKEGSEQPTRVQTEKKKEEKVETQPAEELSTSEKAALAEKAKMESEGKEKEEDSANATSEAQQHAKKRGRKPKP